MALILGHKNKTRGHKIVFNLCGNVSDVKKGTVVELVM